MRLKDTKSCGGATILAGFARGEDDSILQAEQSVRVVYLA
jgi:hypothetical protein